ncbi:hypothetical protein BC939DRAFT_498999 [Gamsiella multidivaricata]|uniref:uncharacterized protein n=1 Tax=Gamsiella multidivaricata TaxID=101098 RepID=UPI00221E58AC|nr:uncharacterized protein BC939DRAFT_498999 [Gamsiella multidivaricata]KAG0363919.1 1-acylglycerol-3-phosphate O-acyltransferase [Gamsiella multidivaricata]KAI7831561.1 hypothetical protein BC939DRAFT_498999 [Gamsiella multidivaricata]
MSIDLLCADSALCSIPGKLALAVVFYLTLPRILAVLPQQPQFIAKYLTFIIGALTMSAVGCVIAIVCTLTDKRHLINKLATGMFSKFVAGPCGITFNVKGEERLKTVPPAIVVCNHQSNIDLIIVGRLYPTYCSIMAKKELIYVPVLGLFMKLANVIFIDRKNHKKALESTANAVAEMKKHHSGMWIFPEGTRSHFDKPNLLPFKKGAFHLAIQSHLPILPIVVEGYGHIYSSRRRAFPGGEIKIRILEPIPTKGLTIEDVDSLMERTRSVMMKHLKEMDQSSRTDVPVVQSKEEKKPIEAALDKETEDVSYESVKKRPRI